MPTITPAVIAVDSSRYDNLCFDARVVQSFYVGSFFPVCTLGNVYPFFFKVTGTNIENE